MITTLINSKKFNFNFFLSNSKKVSSLETGAIENGGATKINNQVYSNIEGSENIIINNENNTISIYVPSTVRTNKKINNSKYVNFSIDYLNQLYTNNDITYENTQGSWYSEDMGKVVVEDITIISLNLATVNETDIQNFKTIASFIKYTMVQEGVSIGINTSLAIV